MIGALFDKVTGLFDRRFTLALLLPTFAFAAGTGALVATMAGWHRTVTWWSGLDAESQVALGIAAAGAVIVLAVIIGTQVAAMTRLLEGYLRWGGADATLGRLGRWRQQQRLARLEADDSAASYHRRYLEFASGPLLSPTRFGNARQAFMSYSGDEQRWGVDAGFWWTRLYLVLPDSVRGQVDNAQASLDQLVVLTVLSAAFGVVALALSTAGLNLAAGLGCAAGAFLLSWFTYLVAVPVVVLQGDLIRSCWDLFRGDLLAKLGWQMPSTLSGERELWLALGQQLYRRGTTAEGETLLNASRQPPAPLPRARPAAQERRAAPGRAGRSGTRPGRRAAR
jgi:hypothetical protein